MNSTNRRMKWGVDPMPHQQKALNEYGGREYYALLGEMGTGKTWIAIADLCSMFADGKVNRACIAVPSGMQRTWEHAIKEICPAGIDTFVMVYHRTWNAYHRNAYLNRLCESDPSELHVMIINHESFSCRTGLDKLGQFFDPELSNTTALIVDEADAFKAQAKKPGSHKCKIGNRSYHLTKHFGPLAGYRRILTGTPIADRPFDLYTPFSFLSPEIINIPSYIAFQKSITYPTRNKGLMTAIARKTGGNSPYIPDRDECDNIRYRDLDKLMARIAPHSHRVSKSECLDLPPKMRKRVYYTISPQTRRHYNEIADELSFAHSGELFVMNNLTVIQKLSQVVGGFIYTPTGESVIIHKNPEKLRTCMAAVQSAMVSGENVIIWCRYQRENVMLEEALETELGLKNYGNQLVNRVFTLDGPTPPDKRHGIVSMFNNCSSSVLITNPATCGVGMNLQGASVNIYYNNTWSLRDRAQSEDRTHRMGQKRPVTIIDLVGEDTIDEKILQIVAEKRRVSEQCLTEMGKAKRIRAAL